VTDATACPPATDDPVWYVAYASNLSAERLRCYLAGGRPPGSRRLYQGGRDPTPPTAATRVDLPGALVFAGRSRVWGGGMAFHELGGAGEVVARAYRLTFGQVSDLVAQESRHPVGRDLDQIDPEGGWRTPSEVYETLVHVGDRDGLPMLTLTTRRPLQESAPSEAYLRTILRGLREVTGWPPERRAAYLAPARGVFPTWTHASLLALCDELNAA
jgi:hypothetical protein